MIFCFNWKKNAAEAHRMLVEVYVDTATDKSCREWFRRFKDRDFSVEDKPRSGTAKKIRRQKIRGIIRVKRKRSLQNHWGVTQQAVSVRLRAMEMIQKQGNCVSYELKRETLKSDFSLANS